VIYVPPLYVLAPDSTRSPVPVLVSVLLSKGSEMLPEMVSVPLEFGLTTSGELR
jgi:hypothetical protein